MIPNVPSTSRTEAHLDETSSNENEDLMEMSFDDPMPDNPISDAETTPLEPYVDMEVYDPEEAFKFYNAYALRIGFSIRKNHQYKPRKNESPTSYRYVCSKEGKPRTNKNSPQRTNSSMRCECKASLTVKLDKNGTWKISVFNKNHNHELIQTPSKKRILKSHKLITEEQKEDIKLLSEQGIRASQIYEILGARAGSRRKLCLSLKDVNNLIGDENKKYLGVDVETTVMYFDKMKEIDPDFFFALQKDENNALKTVFWIDGRSRRSYKEFGDVVIFDTTYSTNTYSMPCAPFIGVNHHRQSIFFGCALVRDEKMITFEWLFETWLEAMHQKHPTSIITDQDPAMRGAIAKIFPNTVHRCCQWHVMRKANEHFAALYGQKEGFQFDLKSCINLSLTAQEFEVNWRNMVKKHALENNKHLTWMFSTRNQCVPAYFRDSFFADMSTSQRSESINAKLKMWVSSTTLMYKFVLQFEKMRQTILDRESEEDIRTKNKIPRLWSKDPIEQDARRVYTRNVFSRFKKNLEDGTNYSVSVLENDILYELKSMRFGTLYKVNVDKPNLKISCDCKGFEHEGLLCPHSLQVMRSIGMHTLSDHYILKRWTKDVNASAKIPFLEESVAMVESQDCETLNSKLKRLTREAQKSDDAYMEACVMVDEVVNKLISTNRKKEHLVAEKENTMCERAILNDTEVSLRDPPVSQCKGKRKPHREKPPYEMNEKKRRTCSTCGKKAGHNSRTCGKNDTRNLGPEVNHEHEEDYEDDKASDEDWESDPEISSDC